MPSIDLFSVKNSAKKFKKIEYRPWNIMVAQESSNIIEEDSFVKKHTIRQQLDNNHTSIEQQTGNRPLTTRQQTGNNQTTVEQQSDNKLDNKLGNKLDNKNDDSWSLEKSNYNFRRLVGLQRKIFLYISAQCISHNNLSSGQIYVREISESLEIASGTIKTTIERLVKKGFLLREKGKSGTGGFTIFYIQETLKNTVLEQLKNFQVDAPSGNNQVTNQTTNQVTSLSSSSSYIYNNTTTTKEADLEKNSLPEEFQFISTQPLEEFGFRQFHLTQLHKSGKLTSEQIQESINYFAFDLQNNNKGEKINGSPLNYFMGILRSGTPYSPPENYESAETKAMKLYVERTKRLRKEEEAAKKEAQTFAFQEWVASLAEEEINLFSAEYKSRNNDDPLKQGALRLHFNQNIWPEKLLELSN